MALKDYLFSFEPSQSLVCLICGCRADAHPTELQCTSPAKPISRLDKTFYKLKAQEN